MMCNEQCKLAYRHLCVSDLASPLPRPCLRSRGRMQGRRPSKARLQGREGDTEGMAGKGVTPGGVQCNKRRYVTKQGGKVTIRTLSTIRHSCVASNSCCLFEIKGSITKCSFISANNATLARSSIAQPPIWPISLCTIVTAKRESQMTPAHLHM